METITVETTVRVSIEKAWELYTVPEHIKNWSFAADDWYAPEASNDLRVGGRFNTLMSARDKSKSFDFGGTYTQIIPLQAIEFTIDDGREAKVSFSETEDATSVTVTFEPENENPVDLQKSGWQAILDNFKKYAESQT
ncbi:MAG: SRPBCC domain-containing protein [Thermoleophilia bacterium]|nr:SRPBCC domain-containing protein [Thermoleophilia bacterium]